MIVRQLCLRHGRGAIVVLLAPLCVQHRALSTHSTTTRTTPVAAEPPGSVHNTSDMGSDNYAESSSYNGSPRYVTRRIGPKLGDISKHYRSQQRLEKIFNAMGAKPVKRYDPLDVLRDPPRPEDVTLEMLMAAQTHLGHHRSIWNPHNSRYIYGTRQGIHIISLEQTAAHLRRAARVVEEVAYKGGLILFAGTRKGHMPIVAKAAAMAGACQLFTKWTPGSITNRDLILGKQPVKVVDEHDQTIEGFNTHLDTVRPLVPDLVICLNPIENFTMLYECGLQSIPTIGVIDTNANPSWVTYTIPANDDRSLAVIAGVLGRAGQKGRERRLEAASKGNPTWTMDRTTLQIVGQVNSQRRLDGMESGMGGSSARGKFDPEADEEAALLGLEEDVQKVSEEDMLGMLAQAQEKAIANLANFEEYGDADVSNKAPAKVQQKQAKPAVDTETDVADEYKPTQKEIDAFWSDTDWFGEDVAVVADEADETGPGMSAVTGQRPEGESAEAAEPSQPFEIGASQPSEIGASQPSEIGASQPIEAVEAEPRSAEAESTPNQEVTDGEEPPQPKP